MLYFIGIWILLIFVCLLIGTALLNILQASSFKRTGDRFIAAVWLGLVALSISLLAVSLVFPLSPLVGLLLAISLIFFSLQSSGTRTELIALRSRLSWSLICRFLTLELAVAAFMTQPITWIDTGLYHLGAIRWLAEYGMVPGLALIHFRFGWTSSWFALAAPLNWNIFNYQTVAVTNGLAFLIFLLHFIISLTHIFTNKIRFADIFITIFNFIAFPLLIFRTLPFIKGKSIMAQILISPSPDILILLLTGVIAWTILIISDQSYLRTGASENKTYLMDERVIPLFLSIGAVSMKLTAIPILLVTSFFYLFKKPLSIQRFLILILIIFLLLSPMLIFGVMTSGCPLSPSTFMCVNLPWSPLSLNTTALSTQKIGVDWALLGRPSDGDNFWLWILWKWSKSSILNLIIILLTLLAVIGVFLGTIFI